MPRWRAQVSLCTHSSNSKGLSGHVGLRRGDEAPNRGIHTRLDGGPGSGNQALSEGGTLSPTKLIPKHSTKAAGKEDSGTCPVSEG